MKLYLAHPFNSRHKMREWELEVEKELGIELINPFFDVERDDKDVIEDKKITLTTQATREERYALSDVDSCELVDRDIDLIGKSDGIIAIVDGSLSYGTIQEMVYAHMFGRKVYTVISNGHVGHPWLRYHSTRVFSKLDELTEYLKKGVGN